MKCSDCQDLLSDYIDNEIHELKRTQVCIHLQKCGECNMIYKDLTQIVSISRALPALAPQNELWGRIEEEIRELISPAEQKSSKGIWERFWGYRLNLSLSLPQLAGGMLSMLVLVVLATTFTYRPEQVPFAQDAALNARSTIIAHPVADMMNPEEAELTGAISRHMQSIEQRRAKWNPTMQELFDRNLKIVDRSIAECRQLVQRNPNDQICHEMMIIAYKEKLRLLERFSSF